VCEEDLSFLNCSDIFWVSSFTAKMQAHREEVRLSSHSQSCLASPSIVGASVSVQLIIARMLAYDVSALCTNFYHIDRVHQISSGSLDAWLSSRLL